MSSVNCSYTDSEGSFTDLSCSGTEPYCCSPSSSGTTNYCSSSDCSADTDSSLAISTVIFWGVLGGLILLCVAIMMVVYLICFNKNPRGCFNQSPTDELLGSVTPIEVASSSSSQTPRDTATQLNHSYGNNKAGLSQNTPRQTDHVIIRVSPQDNNQEVNEGYKLFRSSSPRNINSQATLSETSSNISRQSKITSIGSLQS